MSGSHRRSTRASRARSAHPLVLRTAMAALAAAATVWPLCAQSAFPPSEAHALELKERGLYREAARAFWDLARATEGDARAAALAEYYAVLAFQMGRQSGEAKRLLTEADALRRGAFARAHPMLEDRLALLAFEAAIDGGDVADCTARARELGFLTQWWILGPLDNERGAGFRRAYGPESALDPTASFDGKKRRVQWRRLAVDPVPTGRIDLDAIVRPQDQVLCYAATCLTSDEDRDALLRLGSDEAFAVFLNGAAVAQRDVRRRFAYDQDAVPLHLRAGANLLLLKICDQEGPFEFAARVTAPDGSPLPGVHASADEAELHAAASVKPRTGDAVPPFLGARTAFDRPVEDDASALDAFRLAYLLAIAQPDDPNDRRDHRLAGAAAARLPQETAIRYLLAHTRVREGEQAQEKDDNARRHDYLAILEAQPEHPQALLALAQMDLEGPGAAAAGEPLLRRALAASPDFALARLQLAHALDQLGLDELAGREIERAAGGDAASPPYPEALRQLGHLRERRGDLIGAVECARAVVAADASAQNQLWLAELQLLTGRRDDGVATLQRCLQLHPFARDTAMRLAALHGAEGDTEQALATLRAWLATCPEDDDALVRMAALYGFTGDVEHQRTCLATALDLNPNLKSERRHLEYLEAAQKPFYSDYELAGDEIIAADPGPPADAAQQNDPYYYLLDQHVLRAYRNGTTSEYHHSILRILTEEGVRRAGRHGVPFQADEQRARLLDARVVKPDGRVLRPKLHDAFVAFPPLEVGDVVEIRSRVDDLAPTYFGDYFGLQHDFVPQDGAPCRRSILIVDLEAGREYGLQSANGAPAGDCTVLPSGDTRCKFEMRDLPRRVIEIQRPSAIETDPLVRISTYRDWNEFAAWWYDLIRKQSEISPAIRAKVAELTAGRTTETEKIAAIYDFVTTQIRYTAWEFGVHGYKPYATPVIFDRRHGDCKDKALLLDAMLSLIGVEAYPVLLRADQPRSADDLSLPLVAHFNHCISYLPATETRPEMYLDGTATYHPLDTVPGMDQGADVLVVREGVGEIRHIDWAPPERNRDARELVIDLRESGDATISMMQRPVGNRAVSLREALGNEPGKRIENLERRLAPDFGKVEVEQVDCSDLLDMQTPVEVRVAFEAARFATRQDSGLVLRADLGVGDLMPLVRAETRTTPLLLLGPESEVMRLRYRLPDGYAPVQLPEPVDLATRFGTYRLAWTWVDRELRVERARDLVTPRIEPPDYREFREFLTTADQADRQVVVVRRQEGQ